MTETGKKTKNKNRGFNLVEVIVAATIITIFLSALVGTSNLYLRISHTSPDRAKALYLAEAGIENLLFARDQSWSVNIAPLPTESADHVDNFTRDTQVTAVSDHSKLAVVSVSWFDHNAESTVSLSALISNLYDN